MKKFFRRLFNVRGTYQFEVSKGNIGMLLEEIYCLTSGKPVWIEGTIHSGNTRLVRVNCSYRQAHMLHSRLEKRICYNQALNVTCIDEHMLVN